ncbi:hypothetical protein GOC15_22815 [Sinorhizobium meliloti]|nr:hypothetical protein [Sinorhizobium meliloti]
MANLRDIFDKPFAGPEMRRKYEAALGKFLVTFNAVEDYMRFTTAEICKSLDQTEVWERQLVADDFSRQLKNLRLLAIAEPYFADTPFEQLAALNAKRNKLAHGHYDQDLFSDDFELVGKRQRAKMTIAEIETATEEADDLWMKLGSNLNNFWERQHSG